MNESKKWWKYKEEEEEIIWRAYLHHESSFIYLFTYTLCEYVVRVCIFINMMQGGRGLVSVCGEDRLSLRECNIIQKMCILENKIDLKIIQYWQGWESFMWN